MIQIRCISVTMGATHSPSAIALINTIIKRRIHARLRLRVPVTHFQPQIQVVYNSRVQIGSIFWIAVHSAAALDGKLLRNCLLFVGPVATGSCVRHIPRSTVQHSRVLAASEQIVQSRLKQTANLQAEHIVVKDQSAQAQYVCLKATTLVVLHRQVDASVCHTSLVSPPADFLGQKEVCVRPMFASRLEHAV